jgi:quinol monooxygenase YgiN
MNVLIVKFSLQGIDHETYAGFSLEVAPGVAETPGLFTKAWLSKPETNEYGGVYLFESREAIDAYLTSPAIQAFFETGPCTNVGIEVFDTLEPATSMTSRPLGVLSY